MLVARVMEVEAGHTFERNRIIQRLLVPLEEVTCVDFVRHVGKLVAPPVGHNHVAALLEVRQIVGDLASEELVVFGCGLVDHYGDALVAQAPYHALDGGRSEVVASRFHG